MPHAVDRQSRASTEEHQPPTARPWHVCQRPTAGLGAPTSAVTAHFENDGLPIPGATPPYSTPTSVRRKQDPRSRERVRDQHKEGQHHVPLDEGAKSCVRRR